jgi:hypothetical protein
LWAAAGHKVVKHLSTVSVNLRDFMILCYGIYLYEGRDSRGFIRFFTLLEQLFAYARRYHNDERGFNGMDYINKRINEGTFYISLNDTILSNQRAYGIYGKYIRPLRDMGIANDPGFRKIMEGALSKTDNNAFFKLVTQILDEPSKRLVVEPGDLIAFAIMLKSLTGEEKSLFKEFILKVPGFQHPQNNLYQVVWHNKSLVKAEFQLHQIIQAMLTAEQAEEDLKSALTEIDFTDKVLHPLNQVFIHLLSKPVWTQDEIVAESLFKNLPVKVNYDFRDDTMRKLNEILDLPIFELIQEIIKRNEEVTKSRGNRAWIEQNKDIYTVLYGENGQKIMEIDNNSDYEYPYFLNTYLNLFRQIEME